VLLCAKAEAACKVYMTDLLDERLAVARACGADWTGNANGDCPNFRPNENGTVPLRSPKADNDGLERPSYNSDGLERPSYTTAAIREQEPLGLDVVFECSGDPACIDQAQQLLKPGGTLMLVGIPPTVEVSFDAHVMRTRELTFRSVRRQNECVAPVIELLHAGRIDAAPLLTHRFPLDRIRDAFELVAGYRDGVIKAVIDISGAES
jgi:L-iditol 2-dehydrogenase